MILSQAPWRLRRVVEVGRWLMRRRSEPYVRLPLPVALIAGEARVGRNREAVGLQWALEPDDGDLAGALASDEEFGAGTEELLI